MNSILSFIIISLSCLLHFAGYSGIILSIALFFFPEKVFSLEILLSKKISFSGEKKEPGESLDTPKSMEHLFFNHHILTGFLAILLPLTLLIYLIKMPVYRLDPTLDFDTSDLMLFSKIILLPGFVLFLQAVSFFSILLGVSILLIPHLGFRFLRFLNKNYETSIKPETVRASSKLFSLFLLAGSCLLLFLMSR